MTNSFIEWLGGGVLDTYSQTTLTDAPGFMRITLGVNETGIIIKIIIYLDYIT